MLSGRESYATTSNETIFCPLQEDGYCWTDRRSSASGRSTVSTVGSMNTNKTSSRTACSGWALRGPPSWFEILKSDEEHVGWRRCFATCATLRRLISTPQEA